MISQLHESLVKYILHTRILTHNACTSSQSPNACTKKKCTLVIECHVQQRVHTMYIIH